jgi:glycosyltransferase involved in cell wall biosynthesis
MNSIAILIPSYKPEETLINLIEEIRKLLPENKIFVIRDGMFSEQNDIFDRISRFSNTFILNHAINLGKGRALKTGFNEILANHPEVQGVVTADSDGQHLSFDIAKVVFTLDQTKAMALGSRFANMDNTPLKSKIGNKTTRFIFKSLIGLNLKDTQTGLRGIPKKLLSELMNVSGEKYEYETNMLIKAKQESWAIKEVEIKTVYINQNRGSHFNPILDSMRIYFLIFRFFFSSIISSIVDFVSFSLLISAHTKLSYAVFGARLISGTFNFTLNKKIVFKNKSNSKLAAFQYWTLVALIGTLSYYGTKLLNDHGFGVYGSKIIVDASLFILSFTVQRDVIFDKKDAHEND